MEDIKTHPKYEFLNEICGACGCSNGAHHGGRSTWPFQYCPGHEGQMDWDKGPGTTFRPTGQYKQGKPLPTHEPNRKEKT